MASELQRIRDEAWKVVCDPRANRMEMLLGLQIIAAAKGILLPTIDEAFLSNKQVAQFRLAKAELVTKALRRKEKRQRANRKAYLRRAIAKAEATAAQAADKENIEQSN